MILVKDDNDKPDSFLSILFFVTFMTFTIIIVVKCILLDTWPLYTSEQGWASAWSASKWESARAWWWPLWLSPDPCKPPSKVEHQHQAQTQVGSYGSGQPELWHLILL